MAGKKVRMLFAGAVLAGVVAVLRREVLLGRKRRRLVALRARYATARGVRDAMGGPEIDVGTVGLLRAVGR